MTVSSTTVKNSYSGNGSTTQFAYTFKIFADSDLEVIIRTDSTGAETVKTLTTHYTVAGAGDASGGSITFTSGNIPASGETVVIIREVPQTQAIDYIANDPFPAESHEEGLDRATMTIQQMQEELNRSFKVSATNSITTPEFTDDAASRASKALGFDETGQILTTVADFLPAGGDSAMFQYSTTTADADPGAGKFRLNNATISSATIMYIDDLEFNGTDVSAWVQSWDDVTGNDTNRGRIRISKANTLDTWMVFKVTGAITDATGYSKISLVYIDSAGTFANDDKVFVSFVSSGEDGAIPGYLYNFDTGTSDTDPGAGEIAFNNSTYASATVIFIDDADQNGVTVSTDILTWDDSTSTIRGNLMIYDINDRSTYARFNITGASTDASGYVKLAVTHVASNNTFSAADELSVHFSRSGNKGDTGSTGATGDKGVNGLAMTFSNSTSDADPGAGKVAFNNGTVSSVSVLFIDDVDDAGVSVSTFVQSWDDIVNATARGIITVRKETTPTTFATFKVTGAVTNASGYSKVAVTHIVSSGTFSNADGIGVDFVYSGTDGSGITDVVSDTSPQLGGTLDTNEKTISTVSNRDLELAPNGTGHVTVKGNTNSGSIQFNCESNSHGQIVKSQPHSASVTNTMLLPAGASSTLVSLVSTDTLTNKTLTSPKINEDVAVAATATEINKLDALSRGSLIYGNSSAATAILTKGSADTVLTSDGTDISWSAAAGVADNSITLAKMAPGTDGNIISYDASGDPVAVATGSAGQILTSAGAGAPPTFADAGGGGSWVKISTVTASSSSSVDFDNVASTYRMYAVVGTGITPATANILFQMNFGTDGSTYAANKTSIYYTAYNNTGDSDGALEKVQGYSLGNATGNQTLAAGVNANTTIAKGITMFALFGGLNQGGYVSYNVTTNQFGHNSYIQQTVAAGQVMADSDCIRFIFSSGNIAAGTFTLYGIDQS